MSLVDQFGAVATVLIELPPRCYWDAQLPRWWATYSSTSARVTTPMIARALHQHRGCAEASIGTTRSPPRWRRPAGTDRP